jgi:hypothetical protein
MIHAFNAMSGRVVVVVDSAGRVLELGDVRFLHPEDQVFAQMLTGWRNQQLSRNLAFGTIESRERLVTRFQEYTNEYPLAMDTGPRRRILRRPAQRQARRPVHDPVLSGSPAGFLLLRGFP